MPWVIDVNIYCLGISVVINYVMNSRYLKILMMIINSMYIMSVCHLHKTNGSQIPLVYIGSMGILVCLVFPGCSCLCTYCTNTNMNTSVWDFMLYRAKCLTHWGRVTHICVSKLTIIGSDNGLSPDRRQAIIWTNAGLLLMGPLGKTFSEILIENITFSFKKMMVSLLAHICVIRPQWID